MDAGSKTSFKLDYDKHARLYIPLWTFFLFPKTPTLRNQLIVLQNLSELSFIADLSKDTYIQKSGANEL